MQKKKITRADKIVSVIARGCNQLGYDLAKVLLKNGSKVIVTDDYSKEAKGFISKLKKFGEVDFVDIKASQNLYNSIQRIDYSYYLLYDFLLKTDVFESKQFLAESNYLNSLIETTAKHDGTISLITTIELNKQLALLKESTRISAYSNVEFQRYAETLTAEYYDKSNTDVRILRLGTVLGSNYDLSQNPILYNLINDAVKKDHILIEGEGLDTHFLVNSKDAVFGILKMSFADDTKGEVISIANKVEYNTLSLAYKILELNPTATNIQFSKTNAQNTPILRSIYVPSTNASEFGWDPKESIEKTLAKILEYFYISSNKDWETNPLKQQNFSSSQAKNTTTQAKSKSQELKTPLGKFLDKILSLFFSTYEDYDGNIKRKFNFFGLIKTIFLTVFLAVIFYFLFAPVISITVSSLLLAQDLKTIKNSVSDLNTEKIESALSSSTQYTKNINSNTKQLKWIFDLLNKKDSYQEILNLTNSANLTLEGSYKLFSASSPLLQYIQEFEPAQNFDNSGNVATTKEYRNLLNELAQNRTTITQASNDLKIAQNVASTLNTDNLPKFLQKNATTLTDLQNQYLETIVPISEIIPYLPELLGKDERKTYLFVLQNQAELRSTGGWITSYALIGMEGGQIRQLKIDDAYNVDGAIITQGKSYNAPEDMQKALSIPRWTFSLSNWYPDLTQSTSDMEFFVKESGLAYKLDGIILVNTNVIKDLIAYWGEIEITNNPSQITDFSQAKEIITSENLNEKIFQMHKDYTPGSSLKSDFLVKLSDKVINNLLNAEGNDAIGIASVITESLEKKDLIVNLKSREANSYLLKKGWNGAISSSTNSSGAPFLVDWNWGGNKSNLYLIKNSSLNIQIAYQSGISYAYEGSVINNSQTSIYPEGVYKNYLRIYIPKDAILTSVSGFDQNDYTTYYENNFKVVAGFITIPIKSSSTFKIQYNTPYNITESNGSLSMPISLYKQSGDVAHNYKISVFYPNDWSLKDDYGTIDFEKTDNALFADFSFDRDFDSMISWEWK